MAELTHHDAVAPTRMDYREHERTYSLFLGATKWGTIIVVAILLGMMVGLIATGSWFAGLGTFALALVVAWFVAR